MASEANGNTAVGVSDRIPPKVGSAEDFSKLNYVDVEESSQGDVEQVKPAGGKRRRLFRGALVLGALVILAVAFFWISSGGKKKIDLPVRDRRAQTETTPQSIDKVTEQVIAEVKAAAGASPPPSPSPVLVAPSAGTGAPRDTNPVTIPFGGTVTGVEPPPSQSAPGSSSANSSERSPGVVSERNTERSIRCALIQKPIPPSSKRPAAQESANPRGAAPSVKNGAEKPVSIPPFGTLLPVRTLDSIYTLRPSLTRLQLTRDVRGDGWEMKKGTVLVGQQRGSELDRAYISLTGFIDPNSQKFVRVTGDVRGADGAVGLRGKRRRLGSRWARVLSRAASAAVTLGQAALSRGGGTVVNLPGAVTPEIPGLSPSVVNNREFVEVSASVPAFVLITDLPDEIRGVDPKPTADNGGSLSLGDEELANLLTDGTSDQIRAALPRMTPELKKIAEAVLKEAGDSNVAEGSNQRKP